MTTSKKNRRLLLVTSALPPTMQADNQRARLLAYELPEAGWDVDLLVPDASFQIPIYLDVKSAALAPKGVSVHETAPRHDRLFRALKIRSLSWRALWPMYRRGVELLKEKRFDLIYISTAHFNLLCLGAMWRKKFKVPYILDFHDPWYQQATEYQTTPRNWKHHISVRLAKYMERFALKQAVGLIAVSPVYLEQLRHRYPGFRCVQPGQNAVIPFGATDRDFVIAKSASEDAIKMENRGSTIIYVGAGRSIMAKSFQRICQGLARLKQSEPDLANRIKIRLFGTYAYWQPGDPTELQALAEAEGVGELVEEKPARIGYVEGLGLALRANGLLVLGVDDPAYMPSKLFLYATTGKPLLACMHAQSQVNDYFARFPELGTLIHFGGSPETEAVEDQLMLEFLKQVAERKTFTRENIGREFSAAAMARRHAELFNKVIKAKTQIGKKESGK